jgi:NTE family protein
LEVLEQEGIPIDFIAGTSIGSIIGGLYSIGYNSKQLKETVTSQNWIHMLTDHISREYKNIHEKYDQDRYLLSFNLSTEEGISLPAGVVEGHNIINRLCELTANYHDIRDFNDFPIPFSCVAADIETGKEVIISSGFLPEAIFASMSIPTIFAPSLIDNKLVVDGGIVNNFPVDVVRKMGADIVIGVDIQTKPLKKEEINELTDILGQMISFMGYEKYESNKALCDLIIEPDISGYGTSSFSNSAADTLIERGKTAALSKIKDIRQILAKNDILPEKNEKEYKSINNFEIDHFMAEGINETTIDYLLRKSDLQFPAKHNFSTISEGIRKLYGSENFKKAYFRLHMQEEKIFSLVVKEKTSSSMNAGFNFNSVDKAAILLNLTLKNEIMKGTRLSFDAKLSKNTMLGTSFQFVSKSLPELNLSFLYKNFNLEFYDQVEKISEADTRYLKGSFSLFEIFGSNYLVNLGFRGEYFKFNPFLPDEAEIILEPSENTILSGFLDLRFDNIDDKYYPKNGFDLSAEFSYASNEADNLIENTTTPILSYNFKSAVSPGTDFTVLPSFYGRLLLNDNSEFFRGNMMGGPEPTRLLEYHLPFVGLNRVILVKDKVFILKLELRGRLTEDNYLSLIANGATHFNKFSDWQTRELIGGYGIKYSYNSFIGPIDLLVSTSDYTDKFDFFLNVGRWF